MHRQTAGTSAECFRACCLAIRASLELRRGRRGADLLEYRRIWDVVGPPLQRHRRAHCIVRRSQVRSEFCTIWHAQPKAQRSPARCLGMMSPRPTLYTFYTAMFCKQRACVYHLIMMMLSHPAAGFVFPLCYTEKALNAWQRRGTQNRFSAMWLLPFTLF